MKKTRLCFVNTRGPSFFANRLNFHGHRASHVLKGYRTSKPLLMQVMGEFNVGDVVRSIYGWHFRIVKITHRPLPKGYFTRQIEQEGESRWRYTDEQGLQQNEWVDLSVKAFFG